MQVDLPKPLLERHKLHNNLSIRYPKCRSCLPGMNEAKAVDAAGIALYIVGTILVAKIHALGGLS